MYGVQKFLFTEELWFSCARFLPFFNLFFFFLLITWSRSSSFLSSSCLGWWDMDPAPFLRWPHIECYGFGTLSARSAHHEFFSGLQRTSLESHLGRRSRQVGWQNNADRQWEYYTKLTCFFVTQPWHGLISRNRDLSGRTFDGKGLVWTGREFNCRGGGGGVMALCFHLGFFEKVGIVTFWGSSMWWHFVLRVFVCLFLRVLCVLCTVCLWGCIFVHLSNWCLKISKL